ncbi:hypothetical protein RAG50_26630 [Klebsiella pneumoniae]
MLHRQKGVSCGPAPNGTVIYELRKKEIPVFGKWRYSFTSGMLFVRRCLSGSLIRGDYGDLKQVLVPMIAAQENAKLAVPSNPQDWLADRKARLTIALKRLARAARNGTIPHGSIEDGDVADVADRQVDSRRCRMVPRHSYWIADRRMPSVRITDMLKFEVDALVSQMQMRLPI